MPPTVLAVAAHPDDIEFHMAGTLFKLRHAGWKVHYFNIGNGCGGTASMDIEEIVHLRLEEAQRAAAALDAVFHPPLVNDLDIFYNPGLLAKVAAVVRKTAPDVLLTHSPQDYMEDHMNACRLAVTAAFSRGMLNYRTDPQLPPDGKEITVYHAQPHGNRDQLGKPVEPEFFIDISDVIEDKEKMLACHKSQKVWLDESQGMDSFLRAMRVSSEEMGQRSGKDGRYAEGWRRHSSFGFCNEAADPLSRALKGCLASNPNY